MVVQHVTIKDGFRSICWGTSSSVINLVVLVLTMSVPSKRAMIQEELEAAACEEICISCYMGYFKKWIEKILGFQIGTTYCHDKLIDTHSSAMIMGIVIHIVQQLVQCLKNIDQMQKYKYVIVKLFFVENISWIVYSGILAYLRCERGSYMAICRDCKCDERSVRRWVRLQQTKRAKVTEVATSTEQ